MVAVALGAMMEVTFCVIVAVVETVSVMVEVDKNEVADPHTFETAVGVIVCLIVSVVVKLISLLVRVICSPQVKVDVSLQSCMCSVLGECIQTAPGMISSSCPSIATVSITTVTASRSTLWSFF